MGRVSLVLSLATRPLFWYSIPTCLLLNRRWVKAYKFLPAQGKLIGYRLLWYCGCRVGSKRVERTVNPQLSWLEACLVNFYMLFLRAPLHRFHCGAFWGQRSRSRIVFRVFFLTFHGFIALLCCLAADVANFVTTSCLMKHLLYACCRIALPSFCFCWCRYHFARYNILRRIYCFVRVMFGSAVKLLQPSACGYSHR